MEPEIYSQITSRPFHSKNRRGRQRKQNQQKLLGVIEILHGCNFFEPDDLMLVAVTLGFSGLCVLIQCIYYINEAGLKVSSLIFGKVYSAILLPMYFNIFTSTSLAHKLFSLLIIILTNITTMCIIRLKGCDQRYDFFKKYRKMLRLLRARNQDSI